MAACIPLVAQRHLVPPSRSFESISSSRTPTPTSSERGSPASSPEPQGSPLTFGNPSSKGNARSFLPKSTLKTPASSSETLVNELLRYRASFHKRGFWEEVAILERLYYKNKSQHRQAAHFQKLHECRRLVARIRDLNLAGIVDELVRDFYSGKSLRILQDLKWDSVPTRQSVAFVMARIVGQILLLQKLQAALYKTYGDFYQLLSKTQFMAFALIAIGLCSRCSVLAKLWSQELVDCYKMLQGWIADFPQGDRLQLKDIPDYEKELPKNIEDLFQAPVPDIPPVTSDGEQKALKAQKQQQQSGQSTDATDDGLMDLGEVIKRPVVVAKAKSSKGSPTTPVQAPVQEDLIAKEMPIFATPMVTKKMEQDILGELSNIFNGPSSKNSPKTNTKLTVTTTTVTETKVVKIKKTTESANLDSSISMDDRAQGVVSKKKKKKKLLDADIQAKAASQERSVSPASGIQPATSSRVPTPPTPDDNSSKIFSRKETNPKPKAKGVSAKERPQEQHKSSVPKTSSLLSNLDDIFGGSISTSDSRSTSLSSREEIPTKKRPKTPQSTSKGGKDEIDDLFGSMASKPKKPRLDASAEIDNIFGSPMKKKKKKGIVNQ